MKHPINQHHWFNYLNPITLSIFTTLAISNSSSANPLCYMIDANGKKVNLSFLCPTAKVSAPTPANTQKPTTPTKATPITPPNPTAPETLTPPQSNNSNTQKQEVDKSQLPAIQRAIPLLQNQQTPQVNN
ncbi:hypothetical protein [Geminocystis sp. GBBB08]|uniref:hypothetical protein n=1 Tax=Geminocystis sp. GBBB08 TaxID=2604140 RepID=UPI0027E22674|nr:hypothetical protein [Geminocystis sp. GBBB08]MBL1210901.1 hypothetical protein [Geminocystis sp. GBBB08]